VTAAVFSPPKHSIARFASARPIGSAGGEIVEPPLLSSFISFNFPVFDIVTFRQHSSLSHLMGTRREDGKERL
jgi:hypothetical protein